MVGALTGPLGLAGSVLAGPAGDVGLTEPVVVAFPVAPGVGKAAGVAGIAGVGGGTGDRYKMSVEKSNQDHKTQIKKKKKKKKTVPSALTYF